jgi:hypothetical protein
VEVIVLSAECPSVIDQVYSCLHLDSEQVNLPQKPNLVGQLKASVRAEVTSVSSTYILFGGRTYKSHQMSKLPGELGHLTSTTV